MKILLFIFIILCLIAPSGAVTVCASGCDYNTVGHAIVDETGGTIEIRDQQSGATVPVGETYDIYGSGAAAVLTSAMTINSNNSKLHDLSYYPLSGSYSVSDIYGNDVRIYNINFTTRNILRTWGKNILIYDNIFGGIGIDTPIQSYFNDNGVISGNSISNTSVCIEFSGNNVNVHDNIMELCHNNGIFVDEHTNDSYIRDNIIINSASGIAESGAIANRYYNNIYSGNNISNFSEYGILIKGGVNSIIEYNDIYSGVGVNAYGITHYFLSSGDIIRSNTIHDVQNSAIYYKNGGNYSSLISNNIIYNVSKGIKTDAGTSDLTIYGNNINNASYGLYFPSDNKYNTIHSNYISNSSLSCLYISNFLNSSVYNNYFNNTVNFTLGGTFSGTKFNITNTSGVNIIGTSNIGGNYWSNPTFTGYSNTCIDANNDNFCDVQFNLSAILVDYLPLSLNGTSFIPPFDPSIAYKAAGYIKNNFNISVNNANVTFWNLTHSISTTTNAAGFYNLTAYLVNGIYNFSVSKSGYVTNSGYGTIYTNGQLFINMSLYNVVYIGQCIDVTDGSVLNLCPVRFFQTNFYGNGTGKWFNTTANLSGYYELFGFNVNQSILVNSSYPGYIFTDFSVIPPTYGTFFMDLLFVPDLSGVPAPFLAYGIITSYPYNQGLSNATVTITNGTYTNSSVSNSWGYYEIY